MKELYKKTMYLFIFLLCFVFLLSLLWLRTSMLRVEFELAQLYEQRHKILMENRRLKIEREKMLSLRNVEHIARSRMNMDYLDRKKVYIVELENAPRPFVAGYKLLENNVVERAVKRFQ